MDTQTKYTPGPWLTLFRYGHWSVQQTNSLTPIAQVASIGGPEMAAANAALMASAPQLAADRANLLEACKYVVAWHRAHDSGEGELFGLDFVTTCISAILAIEPEWRSTPDAEALLERLA